MPRIKLTKTAVDGARREARDYESRDAVTPGFLLKVTPPGRRIFVPACTAANGQRRKPAIGRYGELTVVQARGIASDWLADVRRGSDPGADRAAPTVKELCRRFLSDYSLPRNKPSTVRGNRVNINAHIIPKLGQLKVPDVTRSDVARLIASMERMPKPMSGHTYAHGWIRIPERAGLQHCGTHAIRHRAATDIANSGVPLKVGMALTAHKTVTMFMRYVHAEDDPIRAAAGVASAHRRSVVSYQRPHAVTREAVARPLVWH